MSQVDRLCENIVILSDLVRVDERLSWAAPGARGFDPHNKYVVLGDRRALLVDTGVAAHRESLISTLESILASRKLVILLTRNELDCIGNLGPLLDRWPDADVVTTNSLPVVGLVHLSKTERNSVSVRRCPPGNNLDSVGFPNLKVLAPVVRLLGTGWIIDDASKTLFCSDCFAVETIQSPDQELVREAADNLPDTFSLTSGLLAKFEWLRLSDIQMVLDNWDRFFGARVVSALAPSHGRPYRGDTLVEVAIKEYRRAIEEAPRFQGMDAGEHSREARKP